MSETMKNAPTAPVSAVPMQAGLLLIGGATVALFSAAVRQNHSRPGPTRNRRSCAARLHPPRQVEAPANPVAGYVNEAAQSAAPVDALQTLGISCAARFGPTQDGSNRTADGGGSGSGPVVATRRSARTSGRRRC